MFDKNQQCDHINIAGIRFKITYMDVSKENGVIECEASVSAVSEAQLKQILRTSYPDGAGGLYFGDGFRMENDKIKLTLVRRYPQPIEPQVHLQLGQYDLMVTEIDSHQITGHVPLVDFPSLADIVDLDGMPWDIAGKRWVAGTSWSVGSVYVTVTLYNREETAKADSTVEHRESD